MLEFNPVTKELNAYKNKCAIPDIHKVPALNQIIYKNAMKYYEDPEGLRKDVYEVWFPEFKKMLSITDDDTIKLTSVIIRQEDPREYMKEKMARDLSLDKIDYSTEAHKRGSKTDHYTKYVVLAKFAIRGFDNSKAEYVPILHIPWVREDGIIEYNGQEYSFIHALEQTDGISYNQNAGTNNPAAITLRTNRNVIAITNNPKKGLMISIDKKRHEMINVVSAMLRREGYLTEDTLGKVWEEFADSEIINIYNSDKDKDKFMQKWYYSGGDSRVNPADYFERIAPTLRCTAIDKKNYVTDRFNTSKLRDSLNEILSLNQAIDSVLAKPIETSDGEILYTAGRVVTQSIVEDCQRHGIYKLYVECPVDIVGAILAEDIYVGKIPCGTLVTDEIEMAFPEETGMYTIKDHFYKDHINDNLADIFTIDKGKILTQEDIDLIKSSGRDYILIQVGKQTKRINFYTEIISNRQFKGEWIGKEHGKWYYQNVVGAYCEPDGYGYTAYDLVALWSYAVKAFRKQTRTKLPNIDEDFRKLLIPINEQFHRAMVYCTKKGMQQMKQTFSIAWRGAQKEYFLHADSPLIEKFYAYERLFWKYLTTESKCVKQIPASALNNPIAYISEVSKANVFVSSTHAISDAQRRIAIGSYGKIDPYECPQGSKIGIVNNLATYANIDSDGVISTPYYKVHHKNNKSYIDINSDYVFLTVEDEEKYIAADIASMTINDNGEILEPDDTLVLCRIPVKNGKDRMAFEKCKIADVDYLSVNAMQPLSWASATIPFLCNNDAARAVFAVAQMKQAKGLVDPEEPIVQTTAYKMIPRLNKKFGYVADKKEYVHASFRDHRTGYWNILTADGPNELKTGVSAKVNSNVEFQEYRQGDNSVMSIKPRIIPKDSITFDTPEIHEGDVVLSSNFVSENGVLQFGRNAFVMFIPDGYDYEDSVHIRESFAHDMKSYRVNEELLTIRPTTRMPRLKETKEHPVYHCTLPFGPDTDNDTVLISYKDGLSDSHVIEKKLHSAYGYYIGQYAHQNEQGLYDGIVIQLLSMDTIAKGDKMSNRHGNKCTTSIVDEMGLPQINNGWVADAVVNPLGVGSRMNIGQIKEGHLGLVGKVLGIKCISDPYNSITDTELSLLLELCYDVANNVTNWRDIPNAELYPSDLDTLLAQPKYSIIPETLKQHIRENFDKIQVWRNTFDKEGQFEYTYYEELKEVDESGDPIIKKRECKGKAYGGFIYMFKLTQESHKKIHARANDMSDEEYSKMTDAPTHGASRGGGQRMGTMEIDGLCAYGASNYIQELMNERSDNGIARANFNCSTYFDPKIVAPYKTKGRGQRRSVTQLMYLLLALGIMTEADDGEIIPISSNNNVELAHIRSGYLQRELCRFVKQDEEESEDSTEPKTDDFASQEELAKDIISKLKYKGE